jgi:hypothetical protein
MDTKSLQLPTDTQYFFTHCRTGSVTKRYLFITSIKGGINNVVGDFFIKVATGKRKRHRTARGDGMGKRPTCAIGQGIFTRYSIDNDHSLAPFQPSP